MKSPFSRLLELAIETFPKIIRRLDQNGFVHSKDPTFRLESNDSRGAAVAPRTML
jgi:hypothetical protein